jgi:hypothetical protein
VRQEGSDFAFPDLARERPRRSVGRYLVMFHFLSGANYRQIGGDLILLLVLLDRLFSFFNEPLHSLARLGLRLLTEQLERFLQPLDLRFCLGEMFFKGFPELGMMRSLGHFRQRLHQLHLCVKQILQIDRQQNSHVIHESPSWHYAASTFKF